jgi:hypothetical protein
MDSYIRLTDISAYKEAELRGKIHIWLLDYEKVTESWSG